MGKSIQTPVRQLVDALNAEIVPDDKLEDAIRRRRDLLDMVSGWFFPSRIQGQIERLEARLRARDKPRSNT